MNSGGDHGIFCLSNDCCPYFTTPFPSTPLPALYAGQASIQTSMIYIHLSGVELTEAVSKSLATFERWIEMSFSENLP